MEPPALKLPALPFTPVHWDALPATEHKGETGTALWRTLNNGDVRMRVVEYSPGYAVSYTHLTLPTKRIV